MPLSDLPPQQLRAYRGEVSRPADFDAFWSDTLSDARGLRFASKVERLDSPLRVVDVFDVTFAGHGGEPIKAWLHRPPGAAEVPVIVRYAGYNCGRGLPHVVPTQALAGYAVLSVDNRGQGAVAGYACDTPDLGSFRELGLVIRGVSTREGYYYRRLFTDASLAVDAARELPHVHAERVGIAGMSQGGGVALAVAGVVPGLAVALIDVPFLSDIPRGITVASQAPYTEFATLFASYPALVDEALATLRYFDGTAFAAAATATALFSVGLMDTVCPPSTVYAAYNAYAGAKEINEYPYSGHEGGSFAHEAIQLDWLAQHLPI